MCKDSFVFRKEWRDAISALPDDVRLEIYEAIIEYGISGEIPSLKPMARLAFNFVKTALDRDSERYEDVRKKRSEAGRMHKGNQYTNGTSVPKLEQMEQVGTNGTDNVYVNVNNNVVNKEEPSKDGKKKGVSSSSPQELLEKRREKFIESIESYVTIYGKDMTDAFISYWTEPNKSHTKMRYELERTWDVSRRLNTWASRDRSHEAPMARAKRQLEEQQRVIREERQSKTEELLRNRDQWTKQSVSLEEARNSEEYKRAMAEA